MRFKFIHEMLRPNSRWNHWSCSKFADWIRGDKKPFALEWGEWSKWHDEQKKKHSWRYWIAEEFLGSLQRWINLPRDFYNNLRYYIRNRWFDKTHYLQTGFQPGYYHEVDERILYALFNTLVEFLEGEVAHKASWLEKSPKKYKFKNGRCKEALYDYWEWETNLKDNEGDLTPQALSAREMKELYEWWTIKRPNRLDPYSDVTDEELDKMFDFNNRGDEQRQKSIERYNIEEQYEQEDEAMLIRLIKVRRSMWT